jgi:hypothetical protein
MIRTRILTTIGAALLAGSFLAHAQAPAPKAEGKGMEQRKEMRERMKAAHEACKDKPDRRACMSEQMCAKSEDPAKCQARAKEHGQRHAKRMDERQAMHEACTGKRGDELQKCLGDQHKGKGGHREHRGHGDKPKS